METGYPSYMTDEFAVLENHAQVVWLDGNGIIDNQTGLFSPQQVGIGTHFIAYNSPDNSRSGVVQVVVSGCNGSGTDLTGCNLVNQPQWQRSSGSYCYFGNGIITKMTTNRMVFQQHTNSNTQDKIVYEHELLNQVASPTKIQPYSQIHLLR